MPIRLAALINPVGALLQGGAGIVEFTVRNTGSQVSKQIAAAITLPAGVTYVDPPIAGGWTCQSAAGGATCTHGPLAPGALATGYLPVSVTADAPIGAPPSMAVSGASGAVVSARAHAGVAAGGLGARFAATGADTVVTAGAPMSDCRWASWPHSGDGGNSAASLELPGQVLWAGLYWAGYHPAWPDHIDLDQASASPASASPVSAAQSIALRGPGGDYQAVGATEIGAVTGPYGQSAFEGFADVTSLVARYGAGVWSAAPAAPAAPAGFQTSGDPDEPGFYPRAASADLGWTLVVVTADPAAAPGTQVMVLDGAHIVDGASSYLSVPLEGLPPGRQAAVRTVTWTQAGPETSAFAQNLAESPTVNFTGGNVPYLVGVVAVTDTPQP